MIRSRTLMPVLLIVLFTALLSSGCETVLGGKPASLAPAPGFKVKLLTGEEVTLDQFRAGRPMVLNVGATYCPHCIHELQTFKKVYARYKDRAAVLMVFEKSSEDDARTLVVKHDITFPIANDPDGVVGKAYGVSGMPETFFIDKDGRLVDDYFGAIEEGELSDKVENLLK